MQPIGKKGTLLALFGQYSKPIREIVSDVLAVEQEYLSWKKPRGAKERVADIVDRVAKYEAR